MSNGAERGLDNGKAWLAFRATCPKPEDWRPFLRGEKLHRGKLAETLGFANTCPFQQNPKVRNGLVEVEEWLRREGVLLPLGKATGAPGPAASVSSETLRRLADRVETLEQKNAALRAENDALREGLRRYELLDQVLSETLRVPR